MGAVTEAELAEKSKGRRVTLADVEGSIAAEHFFTIADGVNGADIQTLRQRDPHSTIHIRPLKEDEGLQDTNQERLGLNTFCSLILKNGFIVVSRSACADPANYDKEIGERIAREDAVRKIWPLMGYALMNEMAFEKAMLDGKAFESDMVSYIGTKVVHAQPMNRAAYNQLRGWTVPDNECGEDEGYLVEYTDRVEDPPHVAGFKGYISWSPKDVFERAYKPARDRQAKAQPAAASDLGAVGQFNG